MKVVADTLGVARSNLIDRLQGRAKPRRRYHKAQDAVVVPTITALVAARPTYGYRRITAILNRQLRAESRAPVNHRRVYRIMKAHNLLLARKYSVRPEHVHDGKVIVMRSNLRWCSDGFEFRWVAGADVAVRGVGGRRRQESRCSILRGTMVTAPGPRSRALRALPPSSADQTAPPVRPKSMA